MANKKRLSRLANTLEKHARTKKPYRGLGFNMSRFLQWATIPGLKNRIKELDHINHNCGTIGCIAGWAALMAEPGVTPQQLYSSVHVRWSAQKWLDLTDHEAEHLFSTPFIKDYRKITPLQAVRVIRNFVKTGSIDWSPRVTKSTGNNYDGK